jgi:endo-1,4-beta-xylanase
MRSTNSKTKKSTIKLAALTLLLLSTNIMACKTSLDEDLTPTAESSTETVMSAQDLGTKAEAGNYILKDYTLRTVFDFPVGAAVVKELLDDPLYAKTLKRDFSRLSSEGNFKFGSLQPEEGKFTFDKADAIVKFAEENGMKVHGHTLLWAHDGNEPKWLLNFQGDYNAWDRLLKNHIYTVLKHFKGRVQSWDVTNEAFRPGGPIAENIWFRKMGRDYIYKAFQYAHEADPDAKLFMNEYGQEYGGSKMRVLMETVDEIRRRGLHIDGMGFQLHTVLRMEVPKITDNLKIAADKGLLIHISEFDITVGYGMPLIFPLTDAIARLQGEKVKAIVKGYMTVVPKKQQWGITTWGVSDKTSYFNKGYPNADHEYPLLFDKYYKAKRAYRGFIEAGLGR